MGCWACSAGTRDFFSDLAALVGPLQNIFSSPNTILILCPIANQAEQAVVLRRLSLRTVVFLIIISCDRPFRTVQHLRCTLAGLSSSYFTGGDEIICETTALPYL